MPIDKPNMRESNMEAMRAFAMLMVLMVHAVCLSNGFPMAQRIHSEPGGMLYYCFVEGLAIVCVNCFILISGYFGISLRWRSVLNLLFIVLFWKVAIYLVHTCIVRHASFGAFVSALRPHTGDWFVFAYLGLMLFAPALNAFVDNGKKGHLLAFLIAMLSLSSLSFFKNFGGIFSFNAGYSAIAFMPLYVFGRCYRKFWESGVPSAKLVGAALYAGGAMLTAACVVLYALHAPECMLNRLSLSEFFHYNWPLAIVSSMGVLMFFSKLRLKSKAVNWLGASAFSVYLIHLNPIVWPYYMACSRWIYAAGWPWLWLPMLVAYICLAYAVCTLADQARIWCWNRLLALYSRK